MSASRRHPADGHLAEQHLGDRLAALVDGELSHDSRERVLAHLATCAKCKAEADAQRSLKAYFSSTAPPGPSETFLARLQGLPTEGDDDPGGFGGGPVTEALFGLRPDSIFNSPRNTFGYDPSDAHGGILPGDRPRLPDGTRGRGFRVHDMARAAQERAAASRGRRFAFAAAGAVSLAAIALAGVSTGAPTLGDSSTDARGSKASPMRSTQGAGAAAREIQRRRGQPAGAQQGSGPGASAAPMAATGVGAPLLPGVPLAPHRPHVLQDTAVSPIFTGPTVLSPLVRRPVAGFPQFAAAEEDAAPVEGERSGTATALPSPSASAKLSSSR